MLLSWTKNGWEDYLFWNKEDKKTHSRINLLIKDVLRNPFEGTGNPEPLKYGLSGLWSRRITKEHRLVYEVREDCIIVHQCRYHYRK